VLVISEVPRGHHHYEGSSRARPGGLRAARELGGLCRKRTSLSGGARQIFTQKKNVGGESLGVGQPPR